MSIERLREIWPEWSVQEQIGEGSFGKVYRAVHIEQGVSAYAAIKVISIPQSKSEIDSLRSEGIDENGTRTYFEGIVNDFVNEIKLMQSLKGIQNIVGVEDFRVLEKVGEIGWDIYIRMELLTPFNTYVSDKKLSEADVIKLGIDICTALEICSKRNIIHRDIKPENIFVNDYGFYKLGDFGIARKMENMTGGFSQKGTFNYMAPEVAVSTNYDSRVDIYSLGIVLYRLMNRNRLPFLDSDKQLLNPNDRRVAVERRMNGEKLPAPCDASPAMRNLILRACAYDPNQRFTTASEMKKALEAIENNSYVSIPMDVDATTAVRHTGANLDGTTAVRHTASSVSAKQPETFGKKKTKMPQIIAAVVATAIVIAGIAISVPKLRNNKGNNELSSTENSSEAEKNPLEAGSYSEYDEAQISGIIKEADALAAADDYDSAIKRIQAGLATYSASSALSSKLDEYNAVLTVRQNEKIKAEAIATAEQQANSFDYKAAVTTLSAVEKQIGEDSELLRLRKKYTDNYVKETIASVELLLSDNDYEGAKKQLNEALAVVPDNATLNSKLDVVEQYRSVLLSNLTPLDSTFTWNNGMPDDPLKSDYSGILNYSIFHASSQRDNILQPEGDWRPKEYSAEYLLNGEYSELVFSITPYSDCGVDSTSYIQVYIDDVLKYTSPVINQRSEKLNVQGINLSGASRLKLYVFASEYGCLMISDAILESYPSNAQVEEIGDIPLSELRPLGEEFPWNNEYPCDLYGSDYSNVTNYVVFHASSQRDNILQPEGDWQSKEYSTEYYLANEYSVLDFNIAPANDFGSNGTAYIQIYIDDNLIYTSPTITKETGVINTGGIQIDNAGYLKIVVTLGGYGCTIISDAILKS